MRYQPWTILGTEPWGGACTCPRSPSDGWNSRSARCSCWRSSSSARSGGTASAKQIATLHLFGGPVDVQTKGSDAFEPGTEGQSLHEGDTVRTGSTGRATIEYFDDSLTRLDHDTTFTLVTLETLDNEDDSKVIRGEQGDGNSYNRVAELTDSESRFEVETPTATASVQGTVYALIIENGSTTVAVLEGVVKTNGTGASATVPAGKMVVVDAGGNLGAVQQISDELLSSPWLSYNLCDVDEEETCVGGEIVTPVGKPDKKPDKEPKDETPSLPPVPTTDPTGEGDGSPPLNQPPSAGFTGSPSIGPAPLQVQFADNSSDPDGDPLSREWSFGDGASQNGGIGPTHTFHTPGVYTVTLTVRDPYGQTDTKSKDITVQSPPAGFDHILISPSNATIQQGGSQNYTAEAFDTDGASMGKVTGNTSFSIQPNGSCNGNTCTANQTGTHTVTGTFSGDSDTATLVVEEQPPPPCPNYALSFHTRPPSSVEAGKQFNVQIRVDVLDGGSNDGPLTISLSLSGGSFSDGDTSVTWTGQGTVTFNHLTIDQPGSYSMTGTAPCASSTDASPITVTDDGGNWTTLGLVLLVPGLLTTMRGRSRRRR